MNYLEIINKESLFNIIPIIFNKSKFIDGRFGDSKRYDFNRICNSKFELELGTDIFVLGNTVRYSYLRYNDFKICYMYLPLKNENENESVTTCYYGFNENSNSEERLYIKMKKDSYDIEIYVYNQNEYIIFDINNLDFSTELLFCRFSIFLPSKNILRMCKIIHKALVLGIQIEGIRLFNEYDIEVISLLEHLFGIKHD